MLLRTVADGVPAEMRDGKVDEEGWVSWRACPSRVSSSDLARLGTSLEVPLPPEVAAYLGARSHLFDQLPSARYDQVIGLRPTPSSEPLRPFAEFVRAWSVLLDAGFLPFAEWGDGWGPLCVDFAGSSGRMVWFDHDAIIPLGERACRERSVVGEHATEVYGSVLECLDDLFGADSPFLQHT